MRGSESFLRNRHTWTLFTLLLFVFAGAILGDSAAESLLLAHCDTKLLPVMFTANALLLFLTSAFLMSIIDRIDRGAFFTIIIFVHVAAIFTMRGALALGAHFLYPVLFSYAYVSKIVLFLMFWTIANDMTDSRRAAAVFPFIAAGGTIGAIGASFAIPMFLKIISAQNLLVIWGAVVLVLGFLFARTKGSFGKELRPAPGRIKYRASGITALRKDLMLVRQEPLLRNMAILYFLLFFILINQHCTFYTQLKTHLGNAQSLASFLGLYNGCSMFATFVLQVTVAGRVLTKIGSTRSMLFLPVMLCAVFIGLAAIGFVKAFSPGESKSLELLLFWSVTLGMGLRASFFDAFFSPNFQVFFSSLPKDIRGRGKLFIEGVVKPLAFVSASLWLFFAVPRMSFGCSMLLLLCAAALMIVQTGRIRKKYTESLTRSLTGIRSRQVVPLFSFVDLGKEENFLTVLSRALEKEDHEIRKYVIGILAEINSVESIAVLAEHMNAGDDVTRSTIISFLTPLKKTEFKDTFTRYLTSSDRRVVANCILALAALNNFDINEGIEVFLHHTDNRIRANTIMVLWPLWSGRRRDRLSALLWEMLLSGKHLDCASALYAIGALRASEFLPELGRMAASESSPVYENDMVRNNFLKSVANIGGEQALEILLVHRLGGSGKRRNDAVAAVARLLDHDFPVERFFEILAAADYRRRGIMFAALQRRQGYAKNGHDALLRKLAQEEVKEIYRDWASVSQLDAKSSLPGISLLRAAVVEERIQDRLRSVVAASAFLDPSGQVGLAALRLDHDNRHVRARALEVLDNTGDQKINRHILRLLDTNDPAAHAREAASGFHIAPIPLHAAISAYASDPSEWIRECASYAAANLFYDSREQCWLDIVNRSEQGRKPA